MLETACGWFAYPPIKNTHIGKVPRTERPNALVYVLGKLNLVWGRIDPRRMLTPHDFNTTRSHVSYSTVIGVRILIASWTTVLFDSKSNLYAAWKDGTMKN